ncbi:UDP-N-acetylglucosamine 1-carboxyvinyltransferase, partial [Escherichia coli]|nr:UDP-N-acetylglucosamine 1-carboxyvinyltransferase [Escherichia coli]
ASYYMMGAMLGRFKKCVIGLPGGCPLGPRPIDQHIKGFKALGAEIDESSTTSMKIEAKELKGAHIFLDMVSVGATINIMLAAVYATGQTVIENAAKEPEVVDVANFLTSMGANIKGAGTSTIKINGVKELHGSEYQVIPDRIEAGTLLIAGAITRGDIFVRGAIKEHMASLVYKLEEMGVELDYQEDGIRVRAEGELQPVDIKTLPHPGFPTDMQSQMM